MVTIAFFVVLLGTDAAEAMRIPANISARVFAEWAPHSQTNTANSTGKLLGLVTSWLSFETSEVHVAGVRLQPVRTTIALMHVLLAVAACRRVWNQRKPWVKVASTRQSGADFFVVRRIRPLQASVAVVQEV
uniref:Secreted protein n=1 Tax=Noctiluca scintillans TaxID=2966 RepID=A0A7S1F1Y2_NOCSC|mmetsp:Transcript_27772/g.73348  ORF Transcript_27772/g.73348 Transcript_27772/m.73348 type:complete len:132 (+) Transcript_27772:41-436(+)